MILRHFKTRCGVVLGSAIVALSVSCTSSNEPLEDPVVSSQVDSSVANPEQGSLSDANVDESFSASMESASAAPSETEPLAAVPTNAENPSEDPLKDSKSESSPDLKLDAVLAQNVSPLVSENKDSYQGAEDFSADSVTKTSEIAEPESTTTMANAPTLSSEVASERSSPEMSQKPTEVSKSSGNSFVYTVKKGDWLSKVALKVYGPEGSWKDISEKNGLKDANRIHPGQKLVLAVKNEASKKFSEVYGNIVFQKTRDYPSVQPDGHATIFARPGDSLSKLAAAIYGAPGSWKSLYAMNQKSIADADLIFIKQKLTFKAEFPKDSSASDNSAH